MVLTGFTLVPRISESWSRGATFTARRNASLAAGASAAARAAAVVGAAAVATAAAAAAAAANH